MASESDVLDEYRFLAQQAIIQCTEDVNLPHGILSWVSALCALSLFLRKLRMRKRRVFPDNLIVIYTFLAFLFSLNMGLGIVVGNRQYKDFTGLCTFQAAMFQFTGQSLMVWWLVIMVIMYQTVVAQVPVSTMRQRGVRYHLFAWSFPVIHVIVLWAVGAFGPLDLAFTCWISSSSVLRFTSMYIYQFLAAVMGCILAVKILIALSRAGASQRRDERVRLITRGYILQNVCFTLYLLWYLTIAVAYGSNSLIFENFPSAMRHVAKTNYTLCVIWAFSSSSVGLVVTVIFGITMAHCLKIKKTMLRATGQGTSHLTLTTTNHSTNTTTNPGTGANKPSTGSSSPRSNPLVQDKADRENPEVDLGDHMSPPTRTISSEYDDFHAISTPLYPHGDALHRLEEDNRRSLLAPLCASAYDTQAQSPRSVAPISETRSVVAKASSAYTWTILNYARELLNRNGVEQVDDSQLESFVTEELESESALFSTSLISEIDTKRRSTVEAKIQAARARYLREVVGRNSELEVSSYGRPSEGRTRL